MGWAKYEEDNREIMEERLDNMWSLSWREMVGNSEAGCTVSIRPKRIRQHKPDMPTLFGCCSHYPEAIYG